MERLQIEKLSTREIIGCAMLNEKIACEDYNAIGQLLVRSKNPETAKIFFEAAKVEKGHFKKLQKALYRLYGVKVDDKCELPWAAECGIGFGDDTTEMLTATDITREQAVTFLENAERSAEQFYLQALEITERVDLKAIFRTLASEEGRHRTKVKKIATRSRIRNLPETGASVQ